MDGGIGWKDWMEGLDVMQASKLFSCTVRGRHWSGEGSLLCGFAAVLRFAIVVILLVSVRQREVLSRSCYNRHDGVSITAH